MFGMNYHYYYSYRNERPPLFIRFSSFKRVRAELLILLEIQCRETRPRRNHLFIEWRLNEKWMSEWLDERNFDYADNIKVWFHEEISSWMTFGIMLWY